MGSKIKFRVPSLAYWPALLWPGAELTTERDRVQPWARFHEAIAAPVNEDGEAGTPPAVVAEFGIGRGDWLRSRAEAEPEKVFLGVDASLHFIRYADRFIREAQISNLFLAFGDARLTVLPAYIPAGTLAEAHYLFPDPWTRNRHKWRRMLAKRQVPYVLRAVKAEGLIRVRTDVKDYVDEVRESFNELGLTCLADETNRDPQQAVTRWEGRKIAEGETIYELRYVKPAGMDEQLRAMGRWPGFEDVPLDLRGVAKHEPSILSNAGYEPLPETVADNERPMAAQQTGYGAPAKQQLQVGDIDDGSAGPAVPELGKSPVSDVRSRTRLYMRTIAPPDVGTNRETDEHRDSL